MAQQLKLDKETLIKHRFWFLLPAIALCILIGWICVLGVRGDAEKNQTTADGVYRNLQSLQGDRALRNQQWIDGMVKEKLISEQQKGLIWRREYDNQNSVVREEEQPAPPGQTAPLPKVIAVNDKLITWPSETIAEWNKNNRGRPSLEQLSFGENLNIVPYDFREHYRIQIEKLVDMLPWLNESKDPPEGAIRVLGGRSNHRTAAQALLLKPHNLRTTDKEVESREAWTLQEELAIRRELLSSLSSVIENYSRMQDEWRRLTPEMAEASGAPAVPDEGEQVDRASFYNFVWPTTLLETPASAAPGTPQVAPPRVEEWQGWQLDLRMVIADRKRLLRTTARNFSPTMKIPAAKVAVYFTDLNGVELPTPIVLSDVGDLAPGELAGEELLAKPSVKELGVVELPPAAFRISRLVRHVEGQFLDHVAVFNQNWLIDLRLEGERASSITRVVTTLFNRSSRRLPVPYFVLDWSEDPVRRTTGRQEPPRKERLRFPTDVLDAGAKKEFTFEVRQPQPPKRVVALHEAMDWRTTPIKRIDRIEIGKDAHLNSDRTKVVPLRSYDFSAKDYKPAAAGSAPPATPPTGGGAGSPGAAMSNAAANTGPDESANHKVPLKRYIEVSKEVRRLPVALVMVVDAANVNDVLSSMSNSRLSFQVTQAVVNSIPSLGPPASVVAATSGGESRTSGQPSQSSGSGAGGPGAGVSRPGAGMGTFGGQQSSSSTSGADKSPDKLPPIGVVDDSNVVLLQIYGMITLYESPDAEVRIAEERKAFQQTASGGSGQ